MTTVTIDLTDERLFGCHGADHSPGGIMASLRATHSVAAHAIANQIAEQVKPPRIAEPEPWAIVQATVPIDGDQFFLRTSEHDDQHWQDRRGDWWEWSQLENPTLVRGGIEDES